VRFLGKGLFLDFAWWIRLGKYYGGTFGPLYFLFIRPIVIFL